MASSDSLKKFLTSSLVLDGEVTSGAKAPEEAVGFGFLNKETELRIFVLGNAAYWGDRSVVLKNDKVWNFARKLVVPK